MRAPSAQITVLWGASAIAVGRVEPGTAAAIGADGVIRALAVGDPVEDGAVVVETSARGARVWSIASHPSIRSGPREWIVAGQVAERAVGPRDRASIYRGSLLERTALGVRVEIVDAPPVDRAARDPSVGARALLTTAASGVAHALVFAAALLSPPITAPAIASEVSSRWYVHAGAADAMETPPETVPRAAEEATGAAPQFCQDLQGRPLSSIIELQGPEDNPDPHLAARRSMPDGTVEWVLGPTRGWTGAGWEEPIAPWGREESLGRDDRSTMNVMSGPHRCRHDWSCFGEPRVPWSCHTEDVEPPSVARLGLAGIGDDPVVPEETRRWHRPPRVVIGPRMIAANVPRWTMTAAMASVEERARACYDRMLADDPWVTGALDVTVRVRGEQSTAEVTAIGGLADAPALACCVREAHAWVQYDLPPGTRANVLYRIDFGHTAANRTVASGGR